MVWYFSAQYDTSLFVSMICIHCFNFVYTLKLKWISYVNEIKILEKLSMFWQLYHHIEICVQGHNMSTGILNNCCICFTNALSVWRASVTTVSTNSQGNWCTVHFYMWKFNRQKLVTAAHLLTLNARGPLEKSHFISKICIHKLWPTHACMHEY